MKEILRRAPLPGNRTAPVDATDALWVRCPTCKELLYRTELEQSLHVCSKCKHHFRLNARDRIAITLDSGSFQECDAKLSSSDPLGFAAGAVSYANKLAETARATGELDAFVYGSGTIDSIPVVIGAIAIEFIGGSMGTVVGEKVSRAMELALDQHRPLLLFSASGGARMQEGVLALMQMAKALATLDLLHGVGLPYVSVMTDPCYGGVTASFAMLGDVNIGEPGAYIGFAGPRVIEQTTRQKLPPGAATAEFLLQHGMLDLVVPRSDMRAMLGRLLRMYTETNQSWLARERVEQPVGV